MVDRLRLFWNRPLQDADRPRLFALAVVLILAAAVALTQLERPAAPPPQQPTANLPAAASPTLQAPELTAPAEPGEEGTRTAVTASRADVTAAKRAARRFLTGYLPYTYGRRSARRIPAATADLHRTLIAQRPRVPARERRRTPRVVLVQSNAVAPPRAELVALVADGRRRYSVTLELARAAGRWHVARVGS